jgi:hypothetical protein
MPAKKY